MTYAVKIPNVPSYEDAEKIEDEYGIYAVDVFEKNGYIQYPTMERALKSMGRWSKKMNRDDLSVHMVIVEDDNVVGAIE